MSDRHCFIEIATSPRSINGGCTSADIRKATNEEIKNFKASQCDHTQQSLLIYDTPLYWKPDEWPIIIII